MPKRTDISKILIIGSGFVFASAYFFSSEISRAQTLVASGQVPCREERVESNLELSRKRHLLGQLKDQTGAPFSNSKVLLRKLKDDDQWIFSKEVRTDKEGHFDLGLVEPGKYRFLPSPNRDFKQPNQVECPKNGICEFNLELEANPTDQTFAGCEIQ